MADLPRQGSLNEPEIPDEVDDCKHYEPCGRCGGDGCVEYEGHPLDDYIDADPSRLVPCEPCLGIGVVRMCVCDDCKAGGCCFVF